MGELLVSQGLITFEQLTRGLERHHESGEGLGAVLVQLGYISAETLFDVLTRQVESDQSRKVGEILLDFGYIKPEQLQAALDEQRKSNQPLGKILEKLGFIDEQKVIDVLSVQLDVPSVVLEGYGFQPEVMSLLPEDLARRYKMIPLYRQGNFLTVAMADPTNSRNIDHVKFKLGLEIDSVVATEKSIIDAIDKNYCNSVMQDEAKPEPKPALKKTPEPPPPDISENREGHQVRSAVNFLINDAVKEGASDIHLEPGENGLRIRFRSRGELTDRNPIASGLVPAITGFLHAMAGLAETQAMRPRTGRFRIRVEGREVDLRISFFPCLNKHQQRVENIVVHIKDQSSVSLELERIGLSSESLSALKSMLSRREGLVLVGGAENSGITTTLYSMMRFFNRPELSVFSIEDPIEASIEGVNQSQINTALGYGFSEAVSSILSQDPDVILISEIRDAETFQAVARAVRDGRLVISSVRAYDCSDVLARLTALKVDPGLISTTVSAVLCQKLLRRICQKCKGPHTPPAEFLKYLGVPEGMPLYKGKGCAECGGTGYNGRTGLFELLVVNDAMRSVLLQKPSSERLRQIYRKGEAGTYLHDELAKIRDGSTTVDQVLASAQGTSPGESASN